MALGQVKNGIAKSLVPAQKGKANPTPSGGTAIMNGAGTLDVITGLTPLVAAQNKDGFNNVPPAQPFKAQCDFWNVAQRMAVLLPNDGTPDVAQNIKAQSSFVKGCARTYLPHW